MTARHILLVTQEPLDCDDTIVKRRNRMNTKINGEIIGTKNLGDNEQGLKKSNFKRWAFSIGCPINLRLNVILYLFSCILKWLKLINK